MKRFAMVFLVALLGGQLTAGAIAEEKAAEYEGNANSLLQKGDLGKAEFEFRNALQIIQNLPDAWPGLDRINERKQQLVEAAMFITCFPLNS